MFKALIAVAAFGSMVDQTMSQQNCDIIKLAEDYVRIRWPFIDVVDRRRSTVMEGGVWKVRFELPEKTLGYEPEISIDRESCTVVAAVVWQ